MIALGMEGGFSNSNSNSNSNSDKNSKKKVKKNLEELPYKTQIFLDLLMSFVEAVGYRGIEDPSKFMKKNLKVAHKVYVFLKTNITSMG